MSSPIQARGPGLTEETYSGGSFSPSSEVGYRHAPSPEEWLHDTTTRVVAALARKVEVERLSAVEGVPLDKRFKLLERALPSKEQLELSPGRSGLERIVRGYLTDFIRQTLEEVAPCNVVSTHVDRSQNAALWEGRSQAEFWNAASPGVFHSAAAQNYLKRVAFQLTNDSEVRFTSKDAWGVLTEVVKASVQQFKQDSRELLPGLTPHASVYNGHSRIVKFGAALDLNRLRLRR